MLRKNFEAVTNLTPLKKHAVQLCGEEFIKELTNQGLRAKDDNFWRAVNDQLKIPADAYEVRQRQEREEREHQEQARLDCEATETRRLLDHKKQVKRDTRHGWDIVTFQLPNSEMFGQKFMAIAKKESSQFEENTGFCDTLEQAYDKACRLADDRDREEQREIEFQRRYRVLKPLYLVAIYLFSCDDFWGCYGDERSPRDPEARRQFYLEHFNGVVSFNGFDFNILNRLEKEGILNFSTTRKTLSINKVAVRQALETAKHMNIPGMEELLNDKAIHLECLDYKNRYERMQEEFAENMDED